MVSRSRIFDVAVLGATGFTGQQLVAALTRQTQGRGLRVVLAGRRPEALAPLADRSGFATQACSVEDPASLQKLAASSRVLLNLAGPYVKRGEPVVQACVAARCHHLDLSGEVFWMRQMLRRHHAPAQRRGVLLISACGYESLPFDLAAQALARHLQLRHGQRCQQLDVAVRFTGPALRRLSDAVSGGTLGSLQAMLEHDVGDTLQRMDCLLPEGLPEGWNANAVALNNAVPLSPWWNAEDSTVMAPMLPAPFINPALVLRSAALAPEAFAPNFRYREGLAMRDGVDKLLGPVARVLPSLSLAQAGLGGTSRAAQWSAAAALAAPLAALSAAAAGRSQLTRQALRRLVELIGPKPGEGPRAEQLDAMGYELRLRAVGEHGQVLHGLLQAQGHPGYRSTPEMMAAVGLALAEKRLGRGQAGWLSPGIAFGPGALTVLEAAGTLRWTLHHEAIR